MTRLLAAVLLVGVAAPGCAGERRGPAAEGPYVVTAIDYHFHDAHPSLPITLDRPLQFSNQGRNPHNVSIHGTDYDRTFQPGMRITIDPVGTLLERPGRYPFFCKLHADRGMSGVLVIEDG